MTETMPRCETCQHWSPLHDYHWGICNKITAQSGEDGADLDYQPDMDTAYTCLAMAVDVWMSTKHSHGCVLHEPKTPAG